MSDNNSNIVDVDPFSSNGSFSISEKEAERRANEVRPTYEPYRNITFIKEIQQKLGPDWKKSYKPHQILRAGLTMDKLEAIKAKLRQLVPLSTALRAEGFTAEAEQVLYQMKDRQPYRYVFAEFEKALAEGEAAAIDRLNNPKTSKREQDALKWMLERALEASTYAPKPSTKIIKENKTVSVQMRLPQGSIKAVPALNEPSIDAELISDKAAKKLIK